MDCTSRPPSACQHRQAWHAQLLGQIQMGRMEGQRRNELRGCSGYLHPNNHCTIREVWCIEAHQTECRMMPQHFERSSANEVTQHTRTGHLLPTVPTNLPEC